MASNNKFRVLIVDDVAETRENVRKLLQFESDVDVVGVARTGREAIDIAQDVEPDVILMDEPASALDPIATYHIEELIRQIVKHVTIIIVTHNMQQAARVSDYTAFMITDESRIGRLGEFGITSQIFTNPINKETENYISGRFG